MAIKIFLTYIGSFLALSITLLFLVKQFAEGFDIGGKKPVLYGTFSSVIASLAAYFSTLVKAHLFVIFWLLAAMFLLFGIVHMAIVHKKYFSIQNSDNLKIIFAEVFFALSVVLFTIVVFSSLQYFIKDKGPSFMFYPMMLSTLTFFIPMLVWYSFDAAYKIPPPVYTTWSYPINQVIPLPPDNPKEKLLVLGFELSKNSTDTKKTYFRAKAPENIELGDLYYHFINDYNELHPDTAISFIDGDNESVEWLFTMKTKWYQGRRYLNPSMSIRDNDIKENSVIICERMSSSST